MRRKVIHRKDIWIVIKYSNDWHRKISNSEDHRYLSITLSREEISDDFNVAVKLPRLASNSWLRNEMKPWRTYLNSGFVIIEYRNRTSWPGYESSIGNFKVPPSLYMLILHTLFRAKCFSEEDISKVLSTSLCNRNKTRAFIHILSISQLDRAGHKFKWWKPFKSTWKLRAMLIIMINK